ncbi:MAG: hypothetical protein UHD09_02375 [Bifidobacterium sp.]|nr:hypothetical protein [Bifidobacterium sp.]
MAGIGLLGQDPSAKIIAIAQDAVPGVPVGYDMPTGSRKLFLTLSAGAPVTPVAQRWTLTISAYSSTAGILDHADADSMWRALVRALLARRHEWPLIDADLQAGPMTTHDTQSDVDYVYGAVMLTVAMT